MAISDSIRKRTKQHVPKNNVSKNEDKMIARASSRVIDYLYDCYDNQWFSLNHEYTLIYETLIKIKDMVDFIARKNPSIVDSFDESLKDKEIRPDGGVIYLARKNDDGEIIEKLPLVIAEMKHQGTNEKRLNEGLKMQAFGNAIERLGKNLIGIKAMMAYEAIIPFICFGDGCDFASDDDIPKIVSKYKNKTYNDGTLIDIDDIKTKFQSGTKTIRAKIYTLNEFCPLNKIVVFKPTNSRSVPVSMMFRYEPWMAEEMY